MPPRSTWILGLVLAFCLAFVPSAWAVDPPTARQTIVSADFNADDGGFVLAEIDERAPSCRWTGAGSPTSAGAPPGSACGVPAPSSTRPW